MNSATAALPISALTSANEALTQRLPSSLELKHQLPLSPFLNEQVHAHRQAVRAILNGEDSRLLVIVGPCSIHDPESAMEYARNLKKLALEVSDQMLLVIRAYVEKPRTTIGWKGLAYDPHLDGSDDMAAGLTLSRELMRECCAWACRSPLSCCNPWPPATSMTCSVGSRLARVPPNRRSTAKWPAAWACP